MKFLKIGALVLGAVLILFFTVAVFLPDSYHVERSTVIDAKPEVVFDFVNDLRKNSEWSPWSGMDPTMKSTFSDNPVGAGAWTAWTSDNSGEGKMTITESDPPASLRYELSFEEKHHKAAGDWTFETTPDGVKTTWTMGGVAPNLAARYFGLFMEPMVGPHFESGLATLKLKAEMVKPVAEDDSGEQDEASPPEGDAPEEEG